MKRFALSNFDISGSIAVQHGSCEARPFSLSQVESHAVMRTSFHSSRSIFAQAASVSCCGSA